MAMEPLPSQLVNPPPTIATSAFSPGGAYYPTPVNNYNTAPLVNNYSYGNPYGGGGGMAPQTQQQSGFGSIVNNASNIKSVGQFVGNGFNFPQSTMLNNFGTSIGMSAGNVGNIAFGGATEAISPALAAADPSLIASGAGAVEGSGIFAGGGSLSSSLGAAGIGAFAGSFLGRIGGSEMGGTIGGGLGAGIGMAVGGPPGAIIGGLIGGIGGGFFGKKKKGTNASEFAGTLDATGNLGGFGYGAKNAGSYEGYNKSLSEEMSSYMSQAKQYLGLSEYKPISIRGGVNTRHSPSGQPGFITVGDQNFGFDPNDNASRQKAIGQAVAAMAKNSGATDAQVKAMADRLAYDATPQGQAQKFMPFVPIKDNQRFADYMAKFKNQNTVSGTNAPANPVTGSPY